ncbi:MAG: Asd/ArgC dimerization domain-containing protein [bacterium]
MNLLIIGATGLVGKSLISLLEDSYLSFNKIEFVASIKSKNKIITLKNKDYTVKLFEEINLNDFNIACLMTSSNISKLYVPLLLEHNISIVDNSSAYREVYDLTIPEINFIKNKNIYINPNCCIIQSLIPLYYINNIHPIKKIIYNTYQSCSGGGYNIVNKFNNNELKTCIPFIGNVINLNNTTEEEKMIYETKKILNKNIEVFSNCVRVPVLYGHLVNIIIEVDNCSINSLKDILVNNSIYDITCYNKDISSDSNIYTCRLKQLNKNTYSFYTYSNNLLRGASFNTYKIIENIYNNK